MLKTIEELKLERDIMIQQRRQFSSNFINIQLQFHPDADKIVLEFIADFLYHGAPHILLEQSSESIRSTFRDGYCFYFANMLQTAFQRGTICWAAPFGHIVWLDDNNIPYDIEGVNESECEAYIPISFLGESIKDFKHIPNETFNASDEYIQNIIKQYKQSTKVAL